MHPNKKIIIVISTMLLITSFLSGCTLSNIFGTSFTLNSYSVCDNLNFAGIDISFSCSGTITVKTFDSSNTLIDSDSFFYGTHNTILNIGNFRSSANKEPYSLKAYDNDNNEVFAESFSFSGSDLSIDSCDQKWWKREAWKGGYTLIGLIMTVTNNGDVPAYPYEVDAVMDSNAVTGYVLPCVVLPGETSTIKSFIYREDNPIGSDFTVNLKNRDGEIIATGSFDVELEDNVDIEEFRFSYQGRNMRLSLPYPDFLYEYYSALDRTALEDYAFYVFDKYDDHYIDLLSRQLQYSSSSQTDADKINFAASFIQNLNYKEDEGQYDYPNYPIETLFNRQDGCDCEDMSILTASVLDRMGYEVALFRFTNHMAVGVKVDGGISGYSTFDGDYYYLETTSKNHVVGHVPSQYVSKPGFEKYEINSRPILHHNWYNNNLTIYYGTEQGDVVKVTSIVENLGSDYAENVVYEGVFVTSNGLEFKEWDTITSIAPGMKKKVTVMVDIPQNVQTNFETRVKIGSTVHDTVESVSTFP